MKGSHRQFHHQEKSGTVTVGREAEHRYSAGTLNSALKQGGLKKSE